jgi:hypothetical protein
MKNGDSFITPGTGSIRPFVRTWGFAIGRRPGFSRNRSLRAKGPTSISLSQRPRFSRKRSLRAEGPYHTSLGRRPRSSAKRSLRAEGPTHSRATPHQVICSSQSMKFLPKNRLSVTYRRAHWQLCIKSRNVPEPWGVFRELSSARRSRRSVCLCDNYASYSQVRLPQQDGDSRRDASMRSLTVA